MVVDARFKCPFNAIVAGASRTGKTTLISKLLRLKEQIYDIPPENVIVIYKYQQPIYQKMKEEKLVNEFIQINDSRFNYDKLVEKVSPFKDGDGSMIIFDDTLTDLPDNFEQIFTNLSHHMNCSVFYLTQNLFYQNKSFRTLSLNAHYIFVMRSKRNLNQMKFLAQQTCPGNVKFITDSYTDATHNPFTFLCFDFSPDSPDILRLRANIFPEDFPYTIYLEN